MKKSTYFILSLLLILAFTRHGGSQTNKNFNDWLNERIQSEVQARIDQRSNANQTETPSMSGNTTSLVDQSSAADLIGVALNLPGLSAANNGMTETTSTSVTTTAYSLYAALQGENPLNPEFYNRNRDWRRVSITLGYDSEDIEGMRDDRAVLAGMKILLLSRRDASYHPEQLRTVSNYLRDAAANFARLSGELKIFIFNNETVRKRLNIDRQLDFTREDSWSIEDKQYWLHFQNKHLNTAGFPTVLAILGDEGIRDIDRFIQERIDFFVRLNIASQTAIEKIRRAPQLSVFFLSKTRDKGDDEFMAETIFDYGIHNRVALTLNGAYAFRDSKPEDMHGGRVAAQLRLQVTPENRLAGRNPVAISLAGEGKWMTEMKPIYKGQFKVVVPLIEGIDLPVSVTYANRTELIDEEEVLGQFGVTFDLARLGGALGFR